MPIEISITRMAATNEKERKVREEGSDDDRSDNRTMGRKHVVPYGLYRAHGFVSAKLADGSKGTGFSEEDIKLFWDALENMLEHDRSAARGEMTARKLIIFKHKDALGNAHAHKLFDAVEVKRIFQGEEYDLPLRDGSNIPPARRFEDYHVIIHRNRIPEGVEIDDERL